MPQVGVYKLSPVIWFQNGLSHEQDGPNLASGGFDAISGSGRSRYTRSSRRLGGARGVLHQTAFSSLEKEQRMLV